MLVKSQPSHACNMGERVGALVGASLGAAAGSSVGAGVGALVGAAEGVGAPLGHLLSAFTVPLSPAITSLMYWVPCASTYCLKVAKLYRYLVGSLNVAS